MSRFNFEGDFKRRPLQSLGGSSKTGETKEDVLQSAQAKRLRREVIERDRAKCSASLLIQSAYRSYAIRKKLKADWRKEFDDLEKEKSSEWKLERQTVLFLRFYDQDMDYTRLLNLSKHVLLHQRVVTNRIKENVWNMRVRTLLWKGLDCSTKKNIFPAAFIRLMESFTFVPDDIDTEGLIAISKIWFFLINEAKFFNVWFSSMKNKLPRLRSGDNALSAPMAGDYVSILSRPLKLAKKLEGVNIRFDLKSNVYTNNDFIFEVFKSMTSTFLQDSIPDENSHGIVTYLVLPSIREEFPFKLYMKQITTIIEDAIYSAEQLRHICYSFINLADVHVQDPTLDMYALMNAMSYVLEGINPSHCPVSMPLSFYRPDRIDDIYPDAKQLRGYHEESIIIWKALANTLKNIDILNYVVPFSKDKWLPLCRVISYIYLADSYEAISDFKFITSLSYEKGFLRSLYLSIKRSKIKLDERLMIFSWLLSLLMVTLHDGEFLKSLPFSKTEIIYFISKVKDIYADAVMRNLDYDEVSKFSLKSAIHVMRGFADRNTRLKLFSDNVFVSSGLSYVLPIRHNHITFEEFADDYGPYELTLNQYEIKIMRVLMEFPFVLSFQDRVSLWQSLIMREQEGIGPLHGESIQVRRNYIYEDAFEKLSLENVTDLRKTIKISLVNTVGALEAGIDGGGLLREFLTEATKAAVDPNRGLFKMDSQNRIYPNPIAKLLFPDYKKHFFLVGRLVGKSLYQQTLLELPFASYFIQALISYNVSSAVDYLANLDPAFHENLLNLRNFDGDWSSLGLDFTVTVEELGEAKSIELKPGGKDISVNKSNIIEYIHLVADFKINKQTEEETKSFRAGLADVLPLFRIFSWKEMLTLISGSDKPIDIEDWMANTNYGTGYSPEHSTIKIFWQVVKEFNEQNLKNLLKFVTSCSRPPLLGFKDLVPLFGIQNAGDTDRLPSSSTCMNLLKLPQYTSRKVLKQKLVYAISAQAGFELS